ncbi:hypothetical protein OPQ81_002950 [Rhizoctonia solani]|nr:hypothetical protein OPQ81_002950 [Rhizoctonia solani]
MYHPGDGFDPTTHRRRDPPMPLGDTVDYFSVSAATPPGAIHPSGTSLRIKLDNPRPDSPFRSSQLVNGHVHIQSLQYFQIPNLSLRVYFESRTLYWRMELKGAANEFEQTLATIVSPSAQNYHRVMRHEVHRGVVPPSNVPLPWNTPVEVQANQELVLTFSFIIPRKMRITEYKDNPHTPRDLCPVERCHLLRFATQGSEVYNPDTLLRQATDDQVVTRIAFPFVPSLEDVSPLRDDVFFGQDLRKDASGSNRLTEEEVESGKNAVVERVKARGGKWEVYVKGFPAGKSKMWSELYTPSGPSCPPMLPHSQ